MSSTYSDIKLDTKLVGSICGKFHIPSYQRGYRWGQDEVTRLLDDVYTNGTKNYCLQPVVVRRTKDAFELIDGQQRLTTLFLIYKHMHVSSSGFLDDPKFSLVYETREKSEAFLSSIDPSQKEDNIDYWFMCDAYETIGKWFAGKDKKSTLTNMNKFFDENVKIIWYEVDESEDAIALFTRLNIGKIPLTSAELVKAMFLSRDNNPDMDRMTQADISAHRKKQEEISLQWDNIERELHNNALWYFLTNSATMKFQTRIDLVLDLMSGKLASNKEKYHTFFYFDGLKGKQKPIEIWQEIQHTFLILKDWFEDHDLYHKIGYLIASHTKALQEIFALSKQEVNGIGMTKERFKAELDKLIKNSVAIPVNYAELSYEKTNDYARISKLLLLFNVESVRQNGEQTHWFPFEKFKYQKSGSVTWSLEHIHAQQSEGMKRQEEWKEWLNLHLASITALGEDHAELLGEMKRACEEERLERKAFDALQQKVLQKLSSQGNTEYLHAISNLALLNMRDNAALNNATFDVKRNAIIEMDKRGQFIPFCTKMVFLKYYTPSAHNQLHFWGQADRVAYIQAINRTLRQYLSTEIALEQGVE